LVRRCGQPKLGHPANGAERTQLAWDKLFRAAFASPFLGTERRFERWTA
jgi:hypothetical protein